MKSEPAVCSPQPFRSLCEEEGEEGEGSGVSALFEIEGYRE
jgi:hypothetical protein